VSSGRLDKGVPWLTHTDERLKTAERLVERPERRGVPRLLRYFGVLRLSGTLVFPGLLELGGWVVDLLFRAVLNGVLRLRILLDHDAAFSLYGGPTWDARHTRWSAVCGPALSWGELPYDAKGAGVLIRGGADA
jgi:hypothetical protein